MRLLRSRYLDATLPMPRQPLLRTQRAPFPPDRSAGAVNAYSPKPIHQVGFAHPSLYNRKKFTSPYLSTVGAAARETVQILRARHLDVTLTMNPRQPLLRTRRAPFSPDRSAGAVNAYSPKPTHQVGFAPARPSAPRSRAPVGFAPRTPVGFAPRTPVGFAPARLSASRPRARRLRARAPVGFAPARPSASRPRACRLRVPARLSALRR